ncbi:MAG: glycosyltransferase family 2 protein [Bacteroidota bacterium]|nr:glycosyltransferase [Candidatus Kapabacteria bacterium]MDW8219058.1 glycosyltransferase family 2 protein [Bacteroidota bacterium]
MALAIITVFFVITIYNALTAPMLCNVPAPQYPEQYASNPLVSVLIPARNEATTIANCLAGLLGQTYKNLEIIVLDDYSEDKTAEIVREFAQHYPQVRLISGRPLPTGWTGKNWACQQLSAAARGAIYIFTDADNTHAPNAVENTVRWMQRYDLSMLSAFPQQQTETLPEQLSVPVVDMFVYAALPLWLTYVLPYPSLSAANGQWIAFTRQAYVELGGHLSVRQHIVEDIELSRATKVHGLRMITAAGTNLVFCRMYHSFDQVWTGFTKNLFGLVGYSTVGFFSLLVVLFTACILPYCTVWFGEYRWISLGIIVSNLLLRLIIAVKYKHPLFASVVLHPISIGFIIAIGINSYIRVKRGKIEWKSRTIDTTGLLKGLQLEEPYQFSRE